MSTLFCVVRHGCIGRLEQACRSLLTAAGLAAIFLAATQRPTAADDYTWTGTNALWTTTNWVTTTGTTTFPGGSSGTNTAIINSGTVSFAGNDTFGNSGNTSSPVIRIGSGGTLASNGFFNSIWNMNLNGGTLLANGGAASAFPTFQLAGTLLVDGSTASNISVGGGSNNQINIGGNTNLTLTMNVADVTSSTAADLTVGAVLQNLSGNVGALTKTGAGTLVLSAANTYTGATTINGGLLRIASGGSLGSAGNINSTAGGQLSIAGSVTMAANTYFAVGNGILNTTGTTSIDGGSLNVGTSAFLIGGSRSGLGATGGLGTFVVNSGTVTVGVGGGAGGGQDTNRVYLNPYGTSGTSQLLLNGGVFSIARPISDGGGGQSLMAFNGGTLRLGGNSIDIGGATTNVIHSGGAVIDTNGFNGTLNLPLATGTGATAGGLTKINSGTLTLSVANTYTGTTTVSGGVLRYGIANAISTGAITVDSGATLDLATFNDSVGAVTLTSGNIIGTGTLTSTAGFTVTSGSIAAPLAGSAGLTKQGAGTVVLSGANPYSGATSINGGVLQIASGGSLTSAGSINSTAGGLLSISGSVTMAANTYFAVGGGITSTTGTTTIDGGTLTVGNNAFLIGGGRGDAGSYGRGTFVVNSGTVTVGAGGGASGGSDASAVWLNPYGNTGPSSLILNGGVFSTARSIRDGSTSSPIMAFNGGTLQAAAGIDLIPASLLAVTLQSGGAVIDSGSFAATISNALAAGTPSGGLTKIGSGTLTLSAANTYSGTTRINAGVLSITNASGVQNSTLDLNPLDAGTITFGQNSTLGGLTGSRNLDMATRTLSIGNNNQSTTYSGTLSNGAFAKVGSGTLTLSAGNTMAATTVSAGVLQLTGGNNRLSTSGTISLAGGTLDLGGNSQTTSAPVAFSNASTLTSGTLTSTSNTSLVPTGTLALGGNTAFVASRADQRLLLGFGVSNSMTLTGSAASTFTVGGNDGTSANFVGVDNGNAVFTVNGPTLNVQIAAGQANATGGWLRVGANSGATGLLSLVAGTVNVGHSASVGAHFTNDPTANVTSSGTLTISGGVFTVGTGTLTTTAGGNNGYLYLKNDAAGSSGNAIVNLDGGVLSVKRIVAGTGGGTKQFNFNGGTLTAASSDASFMSAAPGFTVNVGNAGGTIDTGASNITIAAALLAGGSGGITKIGAGSLTLSGSNTYTGPTAISAGLLAVNGSVAGAVNVANAASLGGTGTINGLVTVAGGGILAPGTSPGTLTMTSGLSLADSSILNYELLATDTTVGGGINDLTVVTGNFMLDGILNVAGTGDFTTVAPFTTWRLFNYSGGTFTDGGLSLGSMPAVGSGDRYFMIDTATPGQVNLVIVPEPGAIVLAAIGLAMAGWRVSRERLRS